MPLNDWLRQDKYYNMVREKFEGPVAQKFFNVPELLKLLDRPQSGQERRHDPDLEFLQFICGTSCSLCSGECFAKRKGPGGVPGPFLVF